jgi:small nuclear ribonucleoprotein (snRNP)-like protein
MGKKAKVFGSLVITTFILFSAALLTFPLHVKAGPEAVTIKGMSYNVNSSMADNLKAFMGKKVYVTLDSGKTFSGFVKSVGNHLIHLEKLDGKEYFDALIRIENISAIDARFRTP